MKNLIKNRISSDRADSNSVSQIIWIAIAVLIAITVGGIIIKALVDKGNAISECIQDAGNLLDPNPPAGC